MNRSRFSFQDRQATIQKMSQTQYDLLVIGGGITGAGVARDAASRGMKVALVEASDFASGTSSRSSKLIHGGIRYLENMEFKLVFEALSERRHLFEMAPHLVHPLRFLLPMYKKSRVGWYTMGLGMWLYDILASMDAPQLHESLDSEETLDRVPSLETRGLLGSYVYSDAYMDDDRLAIETLRSAHKAGADCLSYAEFQSPLHDSEQRVVGLKCLDRRSNQPFTLRGHHTVCAAGPWTDRLASQLVSSWRPMMRPSKGIHITLPRHRLQLTDAVVMAVDKEKRIIFAIPRHEMIIVGTTDTDFNKDPGEVSVEKADVEYLLRIVDEYFPQAQLKEEDILATYAGVRPLVDDGSEDESQTSREHVILPHSQNVTFVAGGKYTTYRRMAQETVESALEFFPLEEQVQFRQSQTLQPLNEKSTVDKNSVARQQIPYWSARYSIPAPILSALVNHLGAEAEDYLDLLASWQGLPEERFWKALASHAVEQEMCDNVVDFVTRRSSLFLAERDHGLRFLDQILSVFQQKFSWDEPRLKQETQLFDEFVRRHGQWRH